jgi:ATP-binding protein involved in chromosome partitioning
VGSVQPGTSAIKHIVAVASGKGGVGKSTVTTNLAGTLSKMGYKVGVLDADLYGPSQPGLLGSDQHPTGRDGLIVPVEKYGIKFVSMGNMNPGGKALIIRAPLAIKAISQFLTGVLWGELDYLLIDMPPGTGDIQLSLAQQARLSGAIIVSTPQRVALDVAKKGLEMFETVAVPILGIVENMSGFTCAHCEQTTSIFKAGGGEQLAKTLNVPFLGGVPLDPAIMMSGDEGKALWQSHPDSHPAKAFEVLAKNMIKNIEIAQQGAADEPFSVVVENGHLSVEWTKSSKTDYSPYTLRLECPCASCVDEHTGKRIITPDKVSLDVRALAVRPVGRYGVSINFSDGHSTGIYRFNKLKGMAEQKPATFSV